MSPNPIYKNYWGRKKLLSGEVPAPRLISWWKTDELCEAEQVILEAVRNASSLLDYGAGDLRIKEKLVKAGYRGEYHTLDIGSDFDYDYRDLGDVNQKYGAILCLDVIEHLPFQDALVLLERLITLTEPNGALVIQTPNARSIHNPLSWDMTHLHCYNIADLWAYLTTLGMRTVGYRVNFWPGKPSLWDRVLFAPKQYLIARWLGCDYADNLLLVGRRTEN